MKKMILASLCLPLFMFASVSFAKDICLFAAEDFAAAQAGERDESGVVCNKTAPTKKLAPDTYGVSLVCRTKHGGVAVRLQYVVQTKLESFKSPKTGKVYFTCEGVSAFPQGLFP